MTGDRRKFRREGAETRRQALVNATLALIAEQGVSGATVRAIAEKADVTQGLIRHYFSSKDELVQAAYLAHMAGMTEQTFEGAAHAGSARSRLAALVVASVSPPVVDAAAVGLWAGFLGHVRRDTEMREVHARTYHDFRDRLETLIVAALKEAGRGAQPTEARRLAIACNAVIDGLWLEGGALPEAFGPDELIGIGLHAVGAIVGMDLEEGVTT
ncbi:TetR family transcriptional regulator C-terminal domain-containing protein [uncultured Roseovarius sp.]|uniref:TetR/AcrR family transcriptional regulator n=1 Tax=uncultured Roseovarius sp. TaxID=293344 RepID=UPI002605373E|nr:TetR family transcriptional regulator C-terminal domain-containing protein [uncultured Roseovarius sp.]